MSQLFQIHPDNPQLHLIRQAVVLLKRKGVIVYPTDSAYALGCQSTNKMGVQRIRQIRALNDKHCFTLLCRDISELALYVQFETPVFRLLKANTPGPYTFLLSATSAVPRYLINTKRKTIGVRVPNNKIVHALLKMLEEPLVSSTLVLPGMDYPLLEPEAMRDILGKRVDLIIDGGACGLEPTTIIDLADGLPRVIRKGKGSIEPFQLSGF